jgi:hypothetical protein
MSAPVALTYGDEPDLDRNLTLSSEAQVTNFVADLKLKDPLVRRSLS